jgi:hypothetical protein
MPGSCDFFFARPVTFSLFRRTPTIQYHRDSDATIVVVATANSTAAYIAAGRKQKYGAANLVMTLDRKGSSFGNFFQSLFTQMRNGASMPTAWAKLAPQGPSAQHAHCPDTIFACELGQLAFK